MGRRVPQVLARENKRPPCIEKSSAQEGRADPLKSRWKGFCKNTREANNWQQLTPQTSSFSGYWDEAEELNWGCSGVNKSRTPWKSSAFKQGAVRGDFAKRPPGANNWQQLKPEATRHQRELRLASIHTFEARTLCWSFWILMTHIWTAHWVGSQTCFIRTLRL